MVVYVFPGQGSQNRGMGGVLFNEFPKIVEQANKILGYSIATLCLQDPKEQLNQTEYTQAALYVTNALHYMKKIQANSKPSYVAGHSLGEYNALLAANVFDFATGLKLVQKRGELMSQATGGAMAAIVGLKDTEVEQILAQHGLTSVNIANYNSHVQVVISGPKNDINEMQPLFEQAGASLFIPLKVSGAFHSFYMREAQQQFAQFLQAFAFKAPVIPVIANVNAKPYQVDEIQLNLAKQITYPVQWTQSIEYLLAKGEDSFYEVGSGTVLSGLINRIRKGQ